MKQKGTGGFWFGLILMVLLATVATFIAQTEIIQNLRFSPLIVGIVLGMIFANTFRHHIPTDWTPGIIFSSKQVLRTGIVLFGFKITLNDVMAVGLPAIVTDIAVVVLTLLLGTFLGKWFRMDKETTLLTTVGSSICGAAAVLGAEPVVKGGPTKTAVAVSTVVIFGTLAMFLYPTLHRAEVLDMDTRQMGIYTGATLHEVAHVYGAGEAMDAAAEAPMETDEQQNETSPQAMGIREPAVIVKMIRVILLAPVLIILSLLLSRNAKTDGEKRRISVPLFAFLFLAVIAFNSLQLLPEKAVNGILTLDSFMLTMAMTALGSETGFDKFRKAGLKSFLLALCLFVWLIFGGYWLVKTVTAIFAM